jgi:hypothetical protein
VIGEQGPSMRSLLTVRFGSHLYGTATPESDIDLKTVSVPDPVDILLQRARKPAIVTTKQDRTAKNQAGDIDHETIPLHIFMGHVATGQPMYLDVLFAPEHAWTEKADPFWHTILNYRPRMLSKAIAPMLGYCKKQCGVYGLKGTRVAALKLVIATLQELTAQGRAADRLENHHAFLKERFAGVEGIEFQQREGVTGATTLLTVGQKSMPFTATVARSIPVYHNQLRQYGMRAFAAEHNQGVDWKAVSHAQRVGEQAVELLTTGHITFPRPNADELLAIKTGRLPYREVSTRLEDLLQEVQVAADTSSLPERPDRALMAFLVAEVYRKEITDTDSHSVARRIVDMFPPEDATSDPFG